MNDKKKETIQIPSHTDARGRLCAVEAGTDVPFPIRRVFYISDVPPGAERANHVYKHNEFLLCARGSCKLRYTQNGEETALTLDVAHAGALIPAMTWRKLYDFSGDCLLIVLSDAPYSAEDYL